MTPLSLTTCTTAKLHVSISFFSLLVNACNNASINVLLLLSFFFFFLPSLAYYVLFRLTALKPKPNGTDDDSHLQVEPFTSVDDSHDDQFDPELELRRAPPTHPTARPTRPPRPHPPPISLAHGNITLSARTKNNQTIPAIGGHINGLITGGKIYRVLLPANLSEVAGIGVRVDVPSEVASRVVILSRPVLRIWQPLGQRALLVRESKCPKVTPGSDVNFRRPRPRPRPTTTPAPPPPPPTTTPPPPPST